MPRDYKYRTTHKTKSRSTAPWAWLITGLAIGLFAALLVFLQMRSQPAEQTTAAVPTPKTQDPKKARKQDNKPIPPQSKPRFEFYSKLPEMEVVIPEQEITGVKKAGIKQVAKPGTYLLQAGSFRNFKQADQLKAKLALLGLETKVRTVKNNDGSWHRVRVGPYNNLQDLNKSRTLLKRNGVDAILIRLDN